MNEKGMTILGGADCLTGRGGVSGLEVLGGASEPAQEELKDCEEWGSAGRGFTKVFYRTDINFRNEPLGRSRTDRLSLG